MDVGNLLADHPAVSWSAITGVFSVTAGFIIRFRRIGASIERTRLRTSAEGFASEAAERAAFRATLMDEIAVVRGMIKECEYDRNSLRTRLNTAEGQILILHASNEITEKWVSFFRDGAAGKTVAASDRAPDQASHSTTFLINNLMPDQHSS